MGRLWEPFKRVMDILQSQNVDVKKSNQNHYYFGLIRGSWGL